MSKITSIFFWHIGNEDVKIHFEPQFKHTHTRARAVTQHFECVLSYIVYGDDQHTTVAVNSQNERN